MNWLQIVKELWDRLSAWNEAFYKTHAGLETLLGLVIGVLGIYWGWRFAKPRAKAPENAAPLDTDLRLRLLNKVQSERVDPRLRQGLREAIRVDMGLTEATGAVTARLLMYARLESGAKDERPIHEPIQNIFEQTADGQLLILGEPGTGKTNLLLELAQGLIADAKRHATSHPDRIQPVTLDPGQA